MLYYRTRTVVYLSPLATVQRTVLSTHPKSVGGGVAVAGVTTLPFTKVTKTF